eukprot:3901733-Rhodomonas_salina.2
MGEVGHWPVLPASDAAFRGGCVDAAYTERQLEAADAAYTEREEGVETRERNERARARVETRQCRFSLVWLGPDALGRLQVVRFETVKGEHELVMTKEEFTIEGQGKVHWRL